MTSIWPTSTAHFPGNGDWFQEAPGLNSQSQDLLELSLQLAQCKHGAADGWAFVRRREPETAREGSPYKENETHGVISS